jgi:predicted phage terminase large subunit-like protein
MCYKARMATAAEAEALTEDLDELVKHLTPEERAELDGLMLSLPVSLRTFVRGAWSIIEPGTEITWGWHLDAICDHLEAVTRGEIRDLLICVPPRFSKSTVASVCWPAWAWTINPAWRFLCSSYSSDLSMLHAVASRRVIEHPWFQARWGQQFRLTTDQNVKMNFENDRRGMRISTSTGATVTGLGGDFLACDDPHNIIKVQSDAIREADVRWFKSAWTTRRNDPKKSARVVILQRAHEKDVAAECISQGFAQLVLANEYDGRKWSSPVLNRDTGKPWKDPRTKKGELLCPARLDAAATKALKTKELGSYGYASQFQQQPQPPGGGIFKRKNWQYYRIAPADLELIIHSWDMSFKDLETSDYVVGQVWGKRRADAFLLDQVREQMGITASLAAVRALRAKWPATSGIYVEDKANGPAVIELLKREIPGIVAVQAEISKVARARAVEPFQQSGNVFLPFEAPWLEDYLDELAKFPRGQNDDQVDATTQALRVLFLREAAVEQKANLW